MPRSTPAKPNTTAIPGIRRAEPKIISENIANNTELTLMMPVKPGFVPVRDTITYATRARILMGAFNGFRQISREASLSTPFSDVVERISTIQSYRLSLLENDTKLLLAVAFDQPWEPYIRRIWRDTGPFLDSILCNCVDYGKYASANGFEAFSQWVRKTQTSSEFFYIADNLSVDDRTYLDMLEQRDREGPAAGRDLDITRIRKPDVEDQAIQIRRQDPEEAMKVGLRALGVLYRLSDYYPQLPDTEDHEYYHQAVRRLLHGFNTAHIPSRLRNGPFKAELAWYEQKIQPPSRPKPRPAPRAGDIQAGILTPYEDVTHGVALLMRVKNARAAGQFLARLPITRNGKLPRKGTPYYNIGFTHNGLIQMQVEPQDLLDMPQEFREGMAARAGMLGDVRYNHPSKWNLPARLNDKNINQDPETNPTPRVQMSSVDFVLQIRCKKNRSAHNHIWSNKHPLHSTVKELECLPGWQGVQILAVQPMGHQRETSGPYSGQIREHFGFIDGISQPNLSSQPNINSDKWNNEAAIGDVLVGHTNSYDDPAYAPYRRGSLLDNSTFLVIRKLRQDVQALHETLPTGVKQRDQVLAKMMGRSKNGKPLVRATGQNDFTYDNDTNGDKCPIHSHVRRTNPREVKPIIGDDRPGTIHVPRIVRRGMSYGPKVTASNQEAERGLMFMAYNASLAEQFEIVQRWISGGNATGGYSGQSDPFMGVPEAGRKRTFRYVQDGKVMRQDLDDANDPKPIVKLEWGLYLFVPSMRSLRTISQPTGRPGLVARGEEIIAKLRRIEAEQALGFPREAYEVSAFDQWKAMLEDLYPSVEEDTDAVWAAIRAKHKGVLRTPYGVLVGTEKLVKEVFGDDGQKYSIREYWWRLGQSFGDIYLSMDPKPKAFPGKDPSAPPRAKPYHEQVPQGAYAAAAGPINTIINQFSEAWAFTPAFKLARGYLDALPKGEQGNLRVRNLVEFVLGNLAQAWFGIPDGRQIIVAGEPTLDKPNTLHCPYHFIASSRYAFSPQPGPAAVAEGQDHGARLQAATEKWVRKLNGQASKNPTPIGGPMFALLGKDPARCASEIIGVMHGFLPSVLGNVLKSIAVWSDDGNLWRIQEDYLANTQQSGYKRADASLRDPLMRVMQYRPVPDQLHRLVVARKQKLGDQRLSPGDRIVIGMGSASAELLEKGKTDVSWVFGGNYRGPKRGTHGCPGQKIAMGTMLGIAAGLMSAGQFRAEPATLILTLEDPDIVH